ncbi:hypothetical protein EXIGLDRAFT_847908 [Exidia glandulosa HHB12029]|uniref:Uncharacterized protein n=1 Tax=Exidia glandulosa HHB12029 TaxID=1314781 RepID=A0A166ME48_EXIGL|nr:hypothetical protein EXIGLDRAFT_847908 [Exidia glandulosa HHB12029]
MNRTLICDILHFALPTRWNTHNDGECGTGWRVYLASHRHLGASRFGIPGSRPSFDQSSPLPPDYILALRRHQDLSIHLLLDRL